jgi:CheY-like chemotaxis protein
MTDNTHMMVLIAEDEPDIALSYKRALEKNDHEVIIASDGEECLEIYRRTLGQMPKASNNSSSSSAFDAVILDYRIPRKDGIEVAKEILEINPKQRIIFASAYVRETLVDAVKQLKRVVELMQKPFDANALVDTVEDKEVYENLKNLMISVRRIHDGEPTQMQIKDLLENLKKIQKGRTF